MSSDPLENMAAEQVPGGDSGGLVWLRPTISWPRAMTVDRRHLIEVDLQLVTPTGERSDGWPFDHEEFSYTCVLETPHEFDQWAVRDATVMLHRFGGSYGPAQFVVTPRDKAAKAPGDESAERSLGLTIVTERGIRIAHYELKVSVRRAGDAQQPTPPAPPVPPTMIDPQPDLTEVDQWDWSGELERELDLLAATQAAPPGVPDQPASVPDPVAVPAGASDEGASDQPDRLAERYSLMALRRSRSGSLYIDLMPLFFPGARTGDVADFSVRCPPSDEHGTVFAVVATQGDGEDYPPRLLSMRSAKFPPGTYAVSAELLYPISPAHVQFRGLPVRLRRERRRWEEIAAAIPSRLDDGSGPVHLITAIETSGQPKVVARRIERVREFVAHVAAMSEDPVSFSVLSYGPHAISYNRDYPEVRTTTLAWAEPGPVALNSLAGLAARGADPLGYPSAAQVECMLTTLAAGLNGHEGRPVLVIAGQRPPHPSRRDLVTGVIPCPHRNNWRAAAARLASSHPGIGFGLIADEARNPGWADELSRLLRVISAARGEFSASGLAARLRLTGRGVQRLPLPLLNSGGSARSAGAG